MSYRTYNGNCNGAVLLLLLSMVMIMIISCALFSPTDDKHSIHNHSNDIPSIAIRGTESNRILKEQKHCGLLSLRKCKGARACELSGEFCVYKLPTADNMVMNNHGVGGGGTGSGSNYNAHGAQCQGMNRKQCKKCEACSWTKHGSTNICVHSALGGGVDNGSLISQHFKDSMSCTNKGMKGCKKSNACSWLSGICVHGGGFGGNDRTQQVVSGMSSTLSCSQMSRRDCKLSKNCKFNKGKNGGSSSCINRRGRNNAVKPARGKRTAVTEYVDQEESMTDRLSTSYDIIGTEMDDVFGWSEDDDDTPAEDFETQEVEEERSSKFWSRPMLSGSVCIYSNTYPETYINAVGHLLLFDTKEECCNVYDCRYQEEEDVGMANSISIDEDKP